LPNIQISEKLILFIAFIPIFFISITIHEFAHAITAAKLGDSTAKDMGRMTINPIKHADLIGTVLVPLFSFFSGFALIGWAKPVPVDRRNFKNPFKDDAYVSFAGPFSNLVLAVIFVVFFSLAYSGSANTDSLILNILWYGTFFNIFLFFFNLIPIPPLDGSHILFDIFPNKFTASLLKLGLYGSIILLIFIYSPLWKYFFMIVNSTVNLFLKVAGV
jgi:Zn-dependent protease